MTHPEYKSDAPEAKAGVAAKAASPAKKKKVGWILCCLHDQNACGARVRRSDPDERGQSLLSIPRARGGVGWAWGRFAHMKFCVVSGEVALDALVRRGARVRGLQRRERASRFRQGYRPWVARCGLPLSCLSTAVHRRLFLALAGFRRLWVASRSCFGKWPTILLPLALSQTCSAVGRAR